MLLVGSKALAMHLCGGSPRIPKDTDYICTHDEAQAFIKTQSFDAVEPNAKGTTLMCFKKGQQPVELMIAWPGSTTEEILNRGFEQHPMEGGTKFASLNVLYLLKMSHRFLKNSPHFLKTMRDIQLMRGLGAVIEDEALLKRREKETYDYKHPSLMRNKANFFNPDEGVQYQYDHDTIHLAMAVEPLRPAYTNFKHDQAEVMIDKAKWDAQPHAIRLRSVLEESLVLALERSQIPHRHRVDPRRSFEIALGKVCTSIASGWWREFSWESYDEVMALFEQQEAMKPYLQRFDEALSAGIIQPFKKAVMA